MLPRPPAPGEVLIGDDLFDQLRRQIAVRRLEAVDAASNGRGDTAAFDIIDATLEQAAHFARVGETLPSFEHLGRVRRALARVSRSVLLYFLRPVTVEQQRFNGLVVRALRGINANARNLQRELPAVPDDLAALLRAGNTAEGIAR